jgi:hypothetical protein
MPEHKTSATIYIPQRHRGMTNEILSDRAGWSACNVQHLRSCTSRFRGAEIQNQCKPAGRRHRRRFHGAPDHWHEPRNDESGTEVQHGTEWRSERPGFIERKRTIDLRRQFSGRYKVSRHGSFYVELAAAFALSASLAFAQGNPSGRGALRVTPPQVQLTRKRTTGMAPNKSGSGTSTSGGKDANGDQGRDVAPNTTVGTKNKRKALLNSGAF